MKVLFIGQKYGNSYIQYKILKKKYKKVDSIFEENTFPYLDFIKKILIHTNPFFVEGFINKKIFSKIKTNYDLIYVKSGYLIGKKLILNLKKKSKKIVYFCNDNPFVNRDKNLWKLFLKSAQYYDVIAYQDSSRLKLAKRYGLKNSLLVLPPYDKDTHKKQKISDNFKKKNSSDVILIGGWFPERGIFVNKILNLGLNLKIYGTRWNKDPNYQFIKSKVKLGFVLNPNYSKLIQCAKIALCFFSKQNLDTITARSTEIPAIGTLLCSLRTKTMKKNFIENKEAVYFNNPNECVKKCKYYLKNTKQAKKIAKNGNLKIKKILKASNDHLIKKIISVAFN